MPALITVDDDPIATRGVLSRSGRQFALMPASLIIVPHTPSWTLMKAPNSSGVLENPSKPTVLNFAWTSGLSITSRSAPLSLVTTAGGVPVGATMPAQVSRLKPFIPASSKVGSSGYSELR